MKRKDSQQNLDQFQRVRFKRTSEYREIILKLTEEYKQKLHRIVDCKLGQIEINNDQATFRKLKEQLDSLQTQIVDKWNETQQDRIEKEQMQQSMDMLGITLNKLNGLMQIITGLYSYYSTCSCYRWTNQ